MPPDDDHPYGHRKYETLAAAGIFIFLLLAVLEVGRSTLNQLAAATAAADHAGELRRDDRHAPRQSAGGAIRSRREDDGSTASCCWPTRCTRGATSRRRAPSSVSLDGGLAGVSVAGSDRRRWSIAVLIAHTGYQIARETSRILSDRVVIDEEDMHRVVMSVPGVLGCHQIRSRGSSDHAFIDLHVWLPAAMPLTQAHDCRMSSRIA